MFWAILAAVNMALAATTDDSFSRAAAVFTGVLCCYKALDALCDVHLRDRQ